MKSMAAWCAGSWGIGRLFQVTLCVPSLSGPAKDCFPGMQRKAELDKSGLAHFDGKRV